MFLTYPASPASNAPSPPHRHSNDKLESSVVNSCAALRDGPIKDSGLTNPVQSGGLGRRTRGQNFPAQTA